MAAIAGFPTSRLEFDKQARLVRTAAADDLHTMIADEKVTDLLVLSHGWNNDMAEAAALYDELLGNIAALTAKVNGIADRRFAVLAVFWPSKKFADADTISGGAASLGAADQQLLLDMLHDLRGTFDPPAADARLEEARRLVPALDRDPAAREQFADLVRALVDRGSQGDVDASSRFFTLAGDELIDRLSTTGEEEDSPDPDAGGAAHLGRGLAPAADAGRAQGLGDFFGGAMAGARNALNYVTYYQMKERAGLIGGSGLAPILSALGTAFPGLKLHLIGHSFGGRVVAAAAAGARCSSLALLQAAFSHYGFSEDWDDRKSAGAFRAVVASPPRVAGPVLITFTKNDTAVGVAYAIASRLAGQVAAALGDEHDTYGGIGRNGAQKTTATRTGQLLEVGAPYPPFTGSKIFNLAADSFIADHGDVRNPQVAYAILSAIASV